MQVFSVGGAVRDALLGLPARDCDFVVVGSTPDEMLANGFKQVGADFPVFLHPESGDEYALARTERKTGRGYAGFECHAAPDVTLEEDLARRDLTINAMAMTEDGVVIDPYGGQAHLAAKVLRHVRDASFIEDPVRVLRLARFAARYSDFSVDPETMALVARMVAAGELQDLVAERVWQELAKGLMEEKPSRMFQLLLDTGALMVILPELALLSGVPQPEQHHPEVDTFVHALLALDVAAAAGAELAVRFAVLTHDLGKACTPMDQWPHHHDHEKRGEKPLRALCARLRVPTACRDMALLVCLEHTRVHRMGDLTAGSVVQLLGRLDAFRRPERFEALLFACECDARGRLGLEHCDYPQADMLRLALAAAKRVDAGEIAKTCKTPQYIPDQIHAARVRAVKSASKADKKDN